MRPRPKPPSTPRGLDVIQGQAEAEPAGEATVTALFSHRPNSAEQANIAKPTTHND
jgi:hypothetical protein